MAQLLPGRRALSSFENQDTLSSIRTALNENAKNTLEVVANTNATPNTADYYPTGILKQVGASTSSGVYYPTVVIASYSDIIPNDLTVSNITITGTGTFNAITVTGTGTFGDIVATGSGTFNTISASTAYIGRLKGLPISGSASCRTYIGDNFWIETNRGYVYTETAYTSMINGEKNGITLSTTSNAYDITMASPVKIQKSLTIGSQTITSATPIAVICIAGTAPAANTPYNLWVNTGNQVMSYRSNTATTTWTPLGAVFK